MIAAAGIIQSTAGNGNDLVAYGNEVMDVNVKGVMNTIFPFIPKMKVCVPFSVVL